MNIEITEEYKASLVPFPKETLEPLKLPTETFVFLTETGLPLHAGYEITPNAPITFLSMPTIKKYPYLQHPYPNRGRKDRVRPLAVVFLKNTDNREEIIRLLIEYGADPSLADKPGQTAFDFAEITNADAHLIKMLEQANFRLHGVLRGVKIYKDILGGV